MSYEFQQLYKRVCQSKIRTAEFLSELRGIVSPEQELSEAILEQEALKNWDTVQMLILGIQYFPSKIFTPILCSFLNDPQPEINLEDIVDVAFDIKDECLIEILSAKIYYELPGDDFHHFNRKCLQAIANIGGERAKKVIENAVVSSFEEIRNEALRLISKVS